MITANYRQTWASCVILAGMILFSPAKAQYNEDKYESMTDRFVHAGFFMRDFEPRSSNTQADSLRIAYRRFMPTIGFRQGLIDVTFGYTRFSIRGQSKATIFTGIAIGNDFPITHSRTNALHLHVLIAMDYTRADNTAGDKESFNVGSGGLGAGLKYRLKQRGFEFSLTAAEAVHICFEAFSTGTGFSAATLVESLFIFRNVLSLDGVAVGYRFRYQTWNMNNAVYDYKSLSHGAFLGVMF